MADNFARLKHQLAGRIMRDSGLPLSARLVGWLLCQYLNKASGDAWPSEMTIARELSIDLKTVKLPIAMLGGRRPPSRIADRKRKSRFGTPTRYFQIDCDAESRSNTYTPNFAAIGAGVTVSTSGTVTPSGGGNGSQLMG